MHKIKKGTSLWHQVTPLLDVFIRSALEEKLAKLKQNITDIQIEMNKALQTLSPECEHESLNNTEYMYTEEVVNLIGKYDLEGACQEQNLFESIHFFKYSDSHTKRAKKIVLSCFRL